jgi:hypothetical protein
MAQDRATPRSGWLTFSAVVLIMAGALNIISGIEALHDGRQHFGSQILVNNLTLWGLIFLVWGIAQGAAGIGALQGRPFGTYLGIGLATVGAIIWFFLLFSAPIPAAVGTALNLFVIYGLTSAGREAGLLDE